MCDTFFFCQKVITAVQRYSTCDGYGGLALPTSVNKSKQSEGYLTLLSPFTTVFISAI